MTCKLCKQEGADYTLTTGEPVHRECYDELHRALNDTASHERWDKLLHSYGGHALEEKMRRMPAPEGEHINRYNGYNRRYPFDAKKTLVGLDLVSDFIPSGSMDMTEALIMQEAQDAFLGSLTEKQRFVVQMTGEGYKPREIAAMQGDLESGKVRWHLFASRKKLRDKIDE